MSERWLRYDEVVAIFGRSAAEAMLREIETHIRARQLQLTETLASDVRWQMAQRLLAALPDYTEARILQAHEEGCCRPSSRMPRADAA